MQKVISLIQRSAPYWLHYFLSLVIAVLVFFVGTKIIKKFLKIMRSSMEKREMETGVISFFLSACKIALYLLLIVIVAQILGVATSSVVAIVGSAGLAIGLALQGSLANFAGGVLILVMKPFRVGDYIIAGEAEGNVQKIDVVYTTLTTIDNRAVILPNGKLADANIINVTREDKRRVDIHVGVGYDASIKGVKEVLYEVVDLQETRLEDMPIDVVVSDLAESAVIMTVRMWVSPDDYWPTRFRMLEEIKERFDERGIVIPFNQLDVHVNAQ